MNSTVYNLKITFEILYLIISFQVSKNLEWNSLLGDPGKAGYSMNKLWSDLQVKSQKFFLKFLKHDGHRPKMDSGKAKLVTKSSICSASQQTFQVLMSTDILVKIFFADGTITISVLTKLSRVYI